MREIESNLNLQEQLPTDGLTLKEDQKLSELLSKWKGGRLSTPVFTEIARIQPQPIVEVVVLRENNGIVETLLIPRPKDDIVWPEMLHSPGCAIRSSDFERKDNNPLNGAFERLQNKEINSQFKYQPIFVDRLYRKVDRGNEVAEIFFTELPESSNQENYNWYPVDKLDQNPKMIQHQIEHIKLATEQYKIFTSQQASTRSNLPK